MPADFLIARFFFIAGGALLLAGLILWWALPISLSLPPYLFTAVLAGAYGFFCWKKGGHSPVPPTAAGKDEARE
jgi:hypothetical protein